MLTNRMKREIINYTIHFSKGLIEDDHSCPTLVEARGNEEVSTNEIEEFMDEIREFLLNSLG